MNLTDTETLRSRLNLYHQGAENGVTAETLALGMRVTERTIRTMVTELRSSGVPVCGTPVTGYFIAQTQAEVEETYRFLRARSLRSLTLESKLRKIPVGDLVGQLEMELREAPNG